MKLGQTYFIRTSLILDGESNLFGFFMVMVNIGFMYVAASSC
ncbi:hypothetical protein [Priestia megaterium]|nr:hypothetical protein [Priestia megaterium]MDR7242376.1 hypothetical protein [Priestia megaterium]